MVLTALRGGVHELEIEPLTGGDFMGAMEWSPAQIGVGLDGF